MVVVECDVDDVDVNALVLCGCVFIVGDGNGISDVRLDSFVCVCNRYCVGGSVN